MPKALLTESVSQNERRSVQERVSGHSKNRYFKLAFNKIGFDGRRGVARKIDFASRRTSTFSRLSHANRASQTSNPSLLKSRSPVSSRRGAADEGRSRLLRFANRVPLQFDKSACAITRAVETVNWRAYGLGQSKDSDPSLVLTSLRFRSYRPSSSSKTQSKETIDGSEELDRRNSPRAHASWPKTFAPHPPRRQRSRSRTQNRAHRAVRPHPDRVPGKNHGRQRAAQEKSRRGTQEAVWGAMPRPRKKISQTRKCAYNPCATNKLKQGLLYSAAGASSDATGDERRSSDD